MFENVLSLNVEKQLCFVFKINHFHKRVEISGCECFDEIIHNHSVDAVIFRHIKSHHQTITTYDKNFGSQA